jgi:hypothetical protein
MFPATRTLVARASVQRMFFSNGSFGPTAADAAAAAAIAASILPSKDTSRHRGGGDPNSHTSSNISNIQAANVNMKHHQFHVPPRKTLDDQVHRNQQPNTVATIYDNAPDLQRSQLSDTTMRLVVNALGRLGRIEDVVVCVTENVFQGNVYIFFFVFSPFFDFFSFFFFLYLSSIV